MTLPQFLVIGAAKSGTVSLYHYLRQHPQIFMCPVNEPNFFALDGFDARGQFRGPGDRAALQRHCIRDRAAYEALFAAARPGQVIGEASPLYLYSAHAAQRIRRCLPDARLVALLRHPTDRAYANFRHYRLAGLEPLAQFEQALAAEPARLAAGWGPWPFWAYRAAGNYAQQLQQYMELFPAGQLLICFYEELRDDPVALLQKIYRFAGVRDDFVPDTSIRHNVGHRPRNRRLHRLLTRPNLVKESLKALLPGRLASPLGARLRRLNEERLPPLDAAMAQRLTQQYAPEISRLQALTGADLGHWLNR